MSNVPEIKTVVVYASDDIETVLRKLDTETLLKYSIFLKIMAQFRMQQ